MQFMGNKNKFAQALRLFLFMFVASIFSPFMINAEQNYFNVLFPETWYEKGLNSTIFVWHTVCSILDYKPLEQPLELFDIMLGKCAFAHYCFEMMYQCKQSIIHEDIEYLETLLHKLQKQLERYPIKGVRYERIVCLIKMITLMKELLQIPCDI